MNIIRVFLDKLFNNIIIVFVVVAVIIFQESNYTQRITYTITRPLNFLTLTFSFLNVNNQTCKPRT